MPSSIETLPPLDVPSHEPTSVGNDDHPMRIMTRRAAGLEAPGWDDAARTAVAGFFDALATEWHTRSSPERLAVVDDALARGLDPLNEHRGTAVELGSGTGFYSASIARRFACVMAVEIAIEMSRRAPAAPALRAIADSSALPVADGSIDSVLLVNSFLFPGEVARVLRPGGTLVWVNSSGSETPIHLSTDEVVEALPFGTTGISSSAGAGTWVALKRIG